MDHQVTGKVQQNLFFVSFSQFGAAFSFNFINIFLPFYIHQISPYDHEETLLWVGIILGSTGFITAFTSTIWGSLSHHYPPKRLYLSGFFVNSILILAMGFTPYLHLLLIYRIIQGLMGGISTTGFILISSSSPKDKLPFHIGIYQSSMTLGQLVGPPLGSLIADSLGFRGAFIFAFLMLFAAFIFCRLYVIEIPPLPRDEKMKGRPPLQRKIYLGWLVCFMAQIQLMFLPSILPDLLKNFGIVESGALKIAGLVVMLYTATAFIGTYLWSWLSRRIGIPKMIFILFGIGILSQFLQAWSPGLVDFTIFRMIQTGVIAAAPPLMISYFARELKGGVIGFLNSARFAGMALGPFIATSVLAFSSLRFLFLLICGLSLLVLAGFKTFFDPYEARKDGVGKF